MSHSVPQVSCITDPCGSRRCILYRVTAGEGERPCFFWRSQIFPGASHDVMLWPQCVGDQAGGEGWPAFSGRSVILLHIVKKASGKPYALVESADCFYGERRGARYGPARAKPSPLTCRHAREPLICSEAPCGAGLYRTESMVQAIDSGEQSENRAFRFVG